MLSTHCATIRSSTSKLEAEEHVVFEFPEYDIIFAVIFVSDDLEAIVNFLWGISHLLTMINIIMSFDDDDRPKPRT